MKLNRILSTVIIFVMLFTSIVAVFPVGALAAEGSSTVTVDMLDDSEILTDETVVKGIANSALNYKFNTAEEMLNYELAQNYLVSCATEKFTVYVNVYTGFVYYKNNLTGQILTSNPIDPGAIYDENTKTKLMSQLELTFKNRNDNSSDTFFTSMQWIKSGSFLSVSEITGKGISVQYTLGEANTNFIAPVAVIYESFMSDIIDPMFDKFAQIMREGCGDFNQDDINAVLKNLNDTTYSNYKSFSSYDIGENNSAYDGENTKNKLKVTAVQSIVAAMQAYAGSVVSDSDKKAEITEYADAIRTVFVEYNIVDKAGFPPNRPMLSAVENGKTVFLMKNSTELVSKQIINKALRTAVPTYSIEAVRVHEQACGYETEEIITPTFNCEINYTLDANGILNVEIPVSPDVFTFNSARYSLTSFTPLKYFGAGNMDNDGYIFYPDGSGTIVEFEDFYYGSSSGKSNPNIGVDADIYGNDFVYSEITGAHREQISMPVFGIVNDVKSNQSTVPYTDKSKVTNGFFMIIEEGSAISTLGFVTEGNAHKYASVYTKVKPYPSDKIDLSETISVSDNNFYYKISDIGYQGSCRYRINMLTDVDVAANSGYAIDKTFYAPDYSGMAACYRDYLSDKGDLEDLTEVSNDLPLYLEALGSIDVTQRILTFPVTVSTALTSFADIKSVYDDLADITDAIEEFEAKAQEYRTLADEKSKEDSLSDDDRLIIKDYLERAERYEALAGKIQKICNINFRLTGFANGGMYFTYPAKVRWEGAVGGKRGFEELIAYSKEVSAKEGSNLGIYPDFDFLFINNTAAFDGISPDGTAARMIDNRYASKQAYDSIQQSYESLFALVISTNALDGLYTKFGKQYSKFDINTLSVASLGSILNSNMDEKNTVNREDALVDVSELFARMNKADGDNYSLMTDIGNIYSVKYVDHILNASIDSSHFRFSSYAVPFYGMVLHGSMNYAGAPINYSGSPDYDILRSIESGAALYYIICCSNTNYLKEDILLSDYYGIDYANWEEKILEQYALLNDAIGDLQKYKIIKHEILTVERIIDSDERYANYVRLADELVLAIDNSISSEIDRVIKETKKELGTVYGNGFKVNIDEAGILSLLSDLLSDYDDEEGKALISAAASAEIADKLAEYERLYNEENGKEIVINKNVVKYTTKYAYDNGDSISTDRDNYKYTDFTCDNGSVVMVTYSYTNDEGVTDEVVFLINYNNFAVDITLSDVVYEGVKNYTIGEYGCHRLDNGSAATDGIKIK